MKIRVCSVMTALVMGFVGLSRAQAVPPPNDNFTNRIVLTGTDISFDGTLAGATVESGEIMPPSKLLFYGQTETQSVWWDWTAPESGTVLIQASKPSQVSGNAVLAVYSLSNISSGQFIGGMTLGTGLPELFFTFEAIAGTNYQIQLTDTDSTSFHFRLLATNSPCIIEQPRSQTISTGDSVLFTVMAASGSPKGYQWQFNSTNLPGETTPMLAFDSPDASQAGPYQVIITNAAGSVTSQVATLWMTTVDTAPTLRASPSTNNQFAFWILGDVGRRYTIESSGDLRGWGPEWSFQNVGGLPYVVVGWTGADRFALAQVFYPPPPPASFKLLRTVSYHATNEVCNNHLKQLRFAKILFAYENQLSVYSDATNADIMPYFKNGNLPVCPEGGTYSVFTGSWLYSPTCNLPWHVLDEPYRWHVLDYP